MKTKQDSQVRGMYPVKLFAAGIALLLSGTLALGQAVTDTNDAPEMKKDDVVKMEKIEITGSRIKRLDTETTVPVEMYKSEDIQMRGYVNIGDFVQSLSFNSGTENSIYQNGSFTKGAATINLRGLGSQRVLILVNSRRIAPYALLTSNSRSIFDINSLPAAAIDNVEFLKDGASAIYGADAVTGVFNFKLKKNYDGLILTAYYGNTAGKGGKDSGVWDFSAVAGASGSKTSIMAAVNYKHSNSSYIRDYGIKSMDLSYMGPVRGYMYSSSYNLPANVRLTRTQVLASNAATGGSLTPPPSTATASTKWYYSINNSTPLSNPTIGDFAASNPIATTVPTPSGASTVNIAAGSLALVNRNFSIEDYQLYPSYDYTSGYIQLDHTFTENIKAFAQLMYGENTTYYNTGLNPINLLNEGISVSATNPYNPFGIKLDDVLILGNFLPGRKYNVDSTSVNVVGGLRGTVFTRWNWEAAVSYGYNSIITTRSNLITPTAMQNALNGTTRTTAFNPFGPSDNADLVKSLGVTSVGNNKTQVLGYDASASGSVVTLPWGGDLGLAAGLEYRSERLNVNPDPAKYIGYGGTGAMQGDRNVFSLYAELNLPVKMFEFAAAVRMEEYSDFGTATKPKLSLKYSSPKWKYINFALRGSYSESFQAPALGLYYGNQTVAYTSVVDPTLPPGSPSVSVKVISGGNNKLLPEEGITYYGGIVVDLPKIKDLSFSVDFFNMRINQYIVTPSASYVLTPQGQAQFPHAVFRNPDGTLNTIFTVPQNNPAAYQYYQGLDFGLKYTLRNTRIGNFGLTATATRILETGSDTGLGSGYFNNTGLYFNPKWRFNGAVSWAYKRFGASFAGDCIGKYFNDQYTATGWGENPYTTFAATVSYQGPWNTKFTLGCSNLFDNRPPDNAWAGVYGFDQNAYGAGAQGRFLFMRVTKVF